MFQAHRKVALVDVVGTNAHANKVVYELLHHVNAVVYATEQHRLVTYRESVIGQLAASLFRLLSNLVGVVKVGVHPNWVIFLKRIH